MWTHRRGSRSNRTKHFRITHKDDTYLLGTQSRPSLIDIVTDFASELYMNRAVPNSPFQDLFVTNDASMSAYFDADLAVDDYSSYAVDVSTTTSTTAEDSNGATTTTTTKVTTTTKTNKPGDGAGAAEKKHGKHHHKKDKDKDKDAGKKKEKSRRKP